MSYQLCEGLAPSRYKGFPVYGFRTPPHSHSPRFCLLGVASAGSCRAAAAAPDRHKVVVLASFTKAYRWAPRRPGGLKRRVFKPTRESYGRARANRQTDLHGALCGF